MRAKRRARARLAARAKSAPEPGRAMPPAKRAKSAAEPGRASPAMPPAQSAEVTRAYRVWSQLAFFMFTDYAEEGFAGAPREKDVDELEEILDDIDITEYLPSELKSVIDSLKFEVDQESAMSNKYGENEYRNPCELGLVAIVQARAALSDADKEKLLSFLNGQYSDGLFENGVAQTSNGTFEVCWNVTGLKHFDPVFMAEEDEEEEEEEEEKEDKEEEEEEGWAAALSSLQ